MNLYPLGKALTYGLVRIAFRMRYEGLEHIPPKTHGFILASNHRSNFDPLFIAHKVPGSLHFMAKIELFKNRFIGWILRSVNAFPINRGSGDSTAMDTATQVIQNGGILVIFPEGHRSKDGKPLRPRSGVGMLAAQTGADVLPCAVCYGNKLSFRCTVTVRYGPLIPHKDLGLGEQGMSGIRDASKLVMSRIVDMLDKEVSC